MICLFETTACSKVWIVVKGELTGGQNLEIMEDAVHYLAHVGRLVANALPADGALVEFGAGNGLQTSHVMAPTPRLLCVEVDRNLQVLLGARGYEWAPTIDVVAESSLSGLYSINCLEHIEDDEAKLREFHSKLRPGGVLVLYLPALPILFSSMDVAVGHYRRYTLASLEASLGAAGFAVERVRYVDSLGVVPSLVYRLLPGASGRPGVRSVWIYDRLLFPVSRALDRVFWRWLGKNLHAVARKI